MTTAAVPFVFRTKSRKALLPFRSRISSAYCGVDPFSHPTNPPLSPVKSFAVITHSDKLVRGKGREGEPWERA